MRSKEDILAAITHNNVAFQYVDAYLQVDRNFVLEAVSRNGWVLEYLNNVFRSDKEIVMLAISKNGWTFQYADSSLRSNYDFVLEAVSCDARAFAYADKVLRPCFLRAKNTNANYNVALAAVTKNGHALELVDVSLQSNREIVITAVPENSDISKFSNGCALRHVDSNICDYSEIALTAVTQNIDALKYVDRSLLIKPSFIRQLCSRPIYSPKINKYRNVLYMTLPYIIIDDILNFIELTTKLYF